MRYNELLRESRLSDITLSQLKSIFSDYSESIEATPLIRGLDHPDDPFTFKLASSGNVERLAANTSNFGNMVVSNSPLWAEYPKRNNAFICSTDAYYASEYGSVYRVLPKNGTTIGICGDMDFWMSFPYLRNHNLGFEELNESLAMLDRSSLDQTNYVKFIQQLDSLSEEEFGLEESTEKLYDLSRAWDLEPSEALEQLLSPSNNGFTMKDISQFNISGSKEVWFSGECLVVHPDYFDTLLDIGNSI